MFCKSAFILSSSLCNSGRNRSNGFDCILSITLLLHTSHRIIKLLSIISKQKRNHVTEVLVIFPVVLNMWYAIILKRCVNIIVCASLFKLFSMVGVTSSRKTILMVRRRIMFENPCFIQLLQRRNWFSFWRFSVFEVLTIPFLGLSWWMFNLFWGEIDKASL